MLKFSLLSLVSLLAGSASAFAPSLPNTATSTTTALHISSWGVKGNPAFQTAQKKDPVKYIQDYLPEPEAVEARSNIDGTILVSGAVNIKERTDQFLFDLLNHQDSAFEFEKITAFVDDKAFAKKRLLSRSARYTGLLDKLQFIQAETPGALPTAEQLPGVKTWLAVLGEGTTSVADAKADMLAQCHEIAATAAAAGPDLETICVLLTGANELEAAACQAAVDAVQGTGKTYTVLAVGKLEEHPEGQAAYHYGTFGNDTAVLPAKAIFSRQEAYRMVTELLQLECGVNQALTFAEVYNVNVTEAKLIKGLREAGYARPQEIDHMIRKGPTAYKEAIEAFRTENPDAALGYTTNAWWEAEEFQKSRQRSDDRVAAKVQVLQDVRSLEIEAVATEWAKREYFRCSMAGTVENDMTEEDFIKSVWDRAMLEGDLKYRQNKGEVVDETTELADFSARQERKQATMLARAKRELAEIMEEDVDGEPAALKPSATDDDDDDDE